MAADISALRNGVVLINAVSQYPDYSAPWNPGNIVSGSGTGFLIKNGYILTNAHVAGNARFITVEKEGDARKYEARVKYIAHDCDLALLTVTDQSFLQGMTPLELGNVPQLDSTVSVLGYPIGGNRLSVTRGVVSRIDFRIYSHSGVDSHLAIQIDAAINPGNSGGPVLQNNAVVGVAFQGYRGDVAQNVGFMIPIPVVQRFLGDIADHHYDHYVDLGIFEFSLLNPAHRRALGLGLGDYGVLVSHIITAGSAGGILQVGDVLLTIDGLSIFSNGFVELEGERIQMAEVVERKYKGDSVQLGILRQGQESKVTIPLKSPWPYLMQARRHGVRPRFVLFGGLIFQPLSRDFLKSRNIKDVNLHYYFANYLEGEIYQEKADIVVLGGILSDPINAYCNRFVNSIVEEINDCKIKTLSDIASIFKSNADYYVIRFIGRGRPLVLSAKAVQKSRERILKEYGVQKEEYLADSIIP